MYSLHWMILLQFILDDHATVTLDDHVQFTLDDHVQFTLDDHATVYTG